MDTDLEELEREFFALHADRVSAIYRIESTQTPEAARFLLRVAGSENEEDIVRIEALKALAVWEFSDRELQIEIGAGLLEVARSTLDELVQTHAVMRLGPFLQSRGVVEFLAQLVLDDSRDLDLRHNALGSLQSHVRVPAVEAVLRQASDLNDSIGQAAQRLLAPRES